MSWNGSNGASAPKQKPVNGARAVSKGAIAGVIVVLGAAAALYFLMPASAPTPKASAPKEKSTAIAEVVADIAPEKPIEDKVVSSKPKKYWEEDVMPANLTKAQQQKWYIAHMPPAGITNNTSQTEAPPDYAIFDFQAENELSALITMTPGEGLVGDPMYERWFERDFLKSLRQPIIINRNDTEEQAALKRDMIELKKELKARYDAGEDLAELMRKTREEYQELAAYKQDVQSLFRQAAREEGLTAQDVTDLIDACNRMLEEKGIAPMDLGPISRRLLLKTQGQY